VTSECPVAPICNPQAVNGCNVCSACCKSYLKSPADCSECVKEECKSNWFPQPQPSLVTTF
jgi:hypothetical protein